MIAPLSLCVVCLAGCDLAGNNDNEAPELSELTASPESVSLSDTVFGIVPSFSVTAIATDSDKDQRGYTWTAAAGSFEPATENPTRWTPPSEAGQYELTCTVSDGAETDSRTIVVTVLP